MLTDYDGWRILWADFWDVVSSSEDKVSIRRTAAIARLNWPHLLLRAGQTQPADIGKFVPAITRLAAIRL